jgi:exopolyphosphatase / guanosine-5'-triphosphate,3'-diphosphate pyrophosphatase
MALEAQGRLKGRHPVAIIDIGSNSVRLVIYEGVVRSPSILFNEKIMAGLGRGLAKTGRLDQAAMTLTVNALRRFRGLADQAGAADIHVIATAAAREASNGPEFIAEASNAVGAPIRILSGREEAHYAAMGVVSGFHGADGIVADMGGGSLELVEVKDHAIGEGITLPLGGLRLSEDAENNLANARKIAKREIARGKFLGVGAGRTLYAVGGTWRNLGQLHMLSTDYPISIMHEYSVAAPEFRGFLDEVGSPRIDKIRGYGSLGKSRRALVPYGAIVLAELIDRIQPARVSISAYGVREGYLYGLLNEADRIADPLLIAADEFAVLRARSPRHARELAQWTGGAFAALGIDETVDEARWRKAACLMADVAWRSHPDYRGLQAFNLISHGAFVGIDHAGRAYIALANYYRYEGDAHPETAPGIQKLMTDRIAYRAHALGLLMRVIYLLSASMPGMIPDIEATKISETEMRLSLPPRAAGMVADKFIDRLGHLGRFVGKKITVFVRSD